MNGKLTSILAVILPIAGIALGSPIFFGENFTKLNTLPVTGEVVWLRGDDNPAGSVGTWSDQSGNGNNLTQTTLSARPTAVANQIGSHTVVSFDGVDDYMVGGNTALVSNAATFILAINNTQPNGSAGSMMRVQTASQEMIFDLFNNSQAEPAQTLYFGRRGQASQTTVIPSGVCVLSFTFTIGDTWKAWGNGTSLSITSQGAIGGSTNSTVFGADGSNNLFFLNLSIAEVIIYPSVLSDANRRSVEAYLGTKYGVTVASASPWRNRFLATRSQSTPLSRSAFLAKDSPISSLELSIVSLR